MIVEDYFKIARENESVFRAVLRDLRDNHNKLPGDRTVPSDLDTESELETLFEKYSRGERRKKFTIINFTLPQKDYATITVQDATTLSGSMVAKGYHVNPDSSLKYKETITLGVS